MVTYHPERHHYAQGRLLPLSQAAAQKVTTTDASPADYRSGTMAYGILNAHNKSGNPARMAITFDAMASHDITYVGIVQTARASGMTRFPLPYVLTNCHNSLCAVGGTINEDDHLFGLSAAEKYGGEFVPAHLAVIHQYMRERYAGGGRMILASDSHTRYGPYGTLAMGEGGPELVKQLLSRPYEIPAPEVVAVWLTGAPRPGVGPQDVALALIAAVFPGGLVKNKVLEFIGPGIAGLSMDFRNGIDVMTTETTCLSSIWATDDIVKEQLTLWGRGGDYKAIAPQEGAGYDAAVYIDLSKIEPMIALPFHPSAAYPIRVFQENMSDLLHKVAVDAKEQWDLPGLPPLIPKVTPEGLMVDQGVVVGCSGGLFENIAAVRDILQGQTMGQGAFALSVYPASQPMFLSLTRSGVIADLLSQGVTVKTAFCGPCFGAGDVPSNNGLSIRHATRNFPNREGSKPKDGQTAFVALMDARSIAATAARGGLLTSAFELDLPAFTSPAPGFDPAPYTARVYQGVGKPKPETNLRFGPNIADWPAQIALPDDLILTVASALYDPVTTTDELIPSGETSSYRSNPHRLSEFTLSRRDPGYVERAKTIRALEQQRQKDNPQSPGLGSVVVALKPGDGSAREQAASCQRVLGGVANIAREYATKRYRSNLINWGMIPFVWEALTENALQTGDQIEIRGVRAALLGDAQTVPAVIRRNGTQTPTTLSLGDLTRPEREIILAGCLINFYAGQSS